MQVNNVALVRRRNINCPYAGKTSVAADQGRQIPEGCCQCCFVVLRQGVQSYGGVASESVVLRQRV